MSRSLTRSKRLIALVCVFAVSAVVPGSVWAADRENSTSTASLRSSVQRVAAVESHRLEQTRQRLVQNANTQPQTPPAEDPQLSSGSFFKKPLGIAVLAAFGVGVGYALYSSRNDRIRSTGR
jgi:hypothetical protein